MAKRAGSRALSPQTRANLRALPSVERLASALGGLAEAVRVSAARRVVESHREEIVTTGAKPPSFDQLVREARARAESAERKSLRRVLNASGVIVHTNLGRAPLAAEAQAAVADVAAGYSNLEYDLTEGERSRRTDYAEGLLAELCGAEAGFCVNNCAAAVLLTCAALASGRDVVIARSQLVEIGGSFRIPDVVSESGARLVEVGTTNRTRVTDYERAIGPSTGAIMRAHQSNFRTIGFVEDVSIERLCSLADDAGVVVIDDVGSGAVADGVPELCDEPPVRRSVAAGCGCVLFSGDKLFGGPQAGLIVGRRDYIAELRTHPLARALRIDKLSLAALEATLRLYRDPRCAVAKVPVLSMLSQDEQTLVRRAELMRSALSAGELESEVVYATAKVGGGALPLLELEGPAVAVSVPTLGADELARRLRECTTPVIARIREGRVLLDPRTLTDAQAREVAMSVLEVAGV